MRHCKFSSIQQVIDLPDKVTEISAKSDVFVLYNRRVRVHMKIYGNHAVFIYADTHYPERENIKTIKLVPEDIQQFKVFRMMFAKDDVRYLMVCYSYLAMFHKKLHDTKKR